MPKAQDITGIILAGGKNSRMGRNKALVEWRGKRLIDWVIDSIKPVCARIIISSNEVLATTQGYEIVPDRYQKKGPAAGIESGLYHSKTDLNIIVSCDTPLLNPGFFNFMLEKHQDKEISIPIHEGINEPMIGIYRRSVHSVFEEAIKSGLNKPPAIIRSCYHQEVPINPDLNFYQPEMFLNLNSPEDLKIK